MLSRGIPFSNAPGMAYEYSNYGFAILGRVVSRVSGMPYKEYVAKEILGPLGMTSTTLEPASVPPSRLAQGYRWEDAQWKREPQLPDGAFGSMGGMLTSLHDLGTWVSTFLAAWPPRDGPETGPIKRSSSREMQTISRPRPPAVTRDASGAIQLFAGGYAYGLRVSSSCLFATIVAHTGGLPGFGSLMMWLPDYGVGIIAFGNRTYSGWTGTADQAFARLAQTGALQPREPVPSASLVSAREAVSRLVMHWDDKLADSLASVNLFLDRSRDRRKAEIDSLLKNVGRCSAGTGFDVVENAMRGQWVMACERGALRVSITLAPTMPPTVQFLELTRTTMTRASDAQRPRICAQ
jgi:CubicO group peptidase (beta-lactamase class C family)